MNRLFAQLNIFKFFGFSGQAMSLFCCIQKMTSLLFGNIIKRGV